jgi:hypothetical protein
LLNFLVHKYTFESIFRPKKISEEVCPKIYIGKDPDLDPDPDVFKSRIRIQSKIVRIRNTGLDSQLNLYWKELESETY